jgi:hypothetical protein
MRKIILMMPVSVDGFIKGSERELDRHKVDDELHRHTACTARAEGPLRQERRPLARAPVMGWNDHDRGPEADAE